jgi:acyl-CoA thioesterase
MSNDLMCYFEKDRFAAFVGINLIEVKPGYAKANLEISDKHLNAVNIVHGGVIFALADFAFAAASNSYGHVSLGINATISYFQPAKGKTLIAEAKEISASNKIANYNVDIYCEDEEIIARFTGMVYKKKDKLKFD